MPNPSKAFTLLLRVAPLALACGAAAAGEPVIVLDDARMATAGVKFTAAIAPNPADGGSLLLNGRVVVPNSGMEVVLAPVDGRIESLLVNPGQQVRAGQVLARIHSAELLSMQRDLIAARARAETASVRARRDEELHAEGIIARNRVEESRTLRTESDADLREHQQLLQLAGMSADAVEQLRSAADIGPLLTLTARRDGHVMQQLAGPGEAVQAGMPLLRLARLDPLWIELQATREQAQRIHDGDSARVSGCDATGRVIAASLQLGEQSQTITVRVEFARPGRCVTPNQLVQASVTPRARADAMVQVPAASIVRQLGKDHVFVRTPAGVEVREVEVERRTAASAWIRGPVKVGDAIASEGIAALKGSWQGFGAAETQ